MANDYTSTGTHPHEGSGCSAGGAGISPPPENPLYFLFVCCVFVCVAPVCSAPVVNHLGGLQACSVASPLSSPSPSSLLKASRVVFSQAQCFPSRAVNLLAQGPPQPQPPSPSPNLQLLRLALGLERERAGLGWAGLGWAGLGWAGLGWVGLGCCQESRVRQRAHTARFQPIAASCCYSHLAVP